MIKSVNPIFVVLVFSSLISFSFVEKNNPKERLVPGNTVPMPVFSDQSQTLNLRAEEGKYTLLSFWASYDAESRLKNAELCRASENLPDVKMISVSMDCYESVYRTVVKQDKLEGISCYNETDGKHSKIFKEFDLRNGFTNYLIDSEGMIVAKNVTADKLASLLD